MIKNKRLNFIASLIDKNTNILLDIGTDHGYLIKKAFDNGKIRKAIATDINELPLNNAKNNLTNYNVEFILTDGFKGVKSEFDLVVIAGMGGNLIASILKDAPNNNDIKYILQANNKNDKLRRFLSANNFKIMNEHIINDKHYYVILEVVRGEMILNNIDYYLGPILKTKKESITYYKHLYKWYNTIIQKNGLTEGEIVLKANILLNHIETNKGKK